MKKYLLPTILIGLSIALFFLYINPTYNKIQETKMMGEENAELLEKSEELREVRDDLLEEYNALGQTQIEPLNKLLPDNVDNIRLLIEIDGVAGRHGMSLREVVFVNPESAEASTIQGALATGADIGAINLSFVVVADYEDFASFIEDLEKSLRLVDIQQIDFRTNDEGFNEFRVELATYWLKSDSSL